MSSGAQDYVTVFDLAKAGYRTWPFAAAGLFFVAVGILLVRNRRNLRSPKWATNAVSFCFLGFSLLWTVASFISTYGQHHRLVRAMREGRTAAVEGPVENLVPMAPRGKGIEHFTVAGVYFQYMDPGLVTEAFNQASTRGGPIRAGRVVRITYVGGDIVRVEVHR